MFMRFYDWIHSAPQRQCFGTQLLVMAPQAQFRDCHADPLAADRNRQLSVEHVS